MEVILLQKLYIRYKAEHLSTYTLDEITPDQCRAKLGELNTIAYLELTHKKNDEADTATVVLNLSKLFLEQPQGKMTTWDDITVSLTEKLISGYMVSTTTTPDKEVIKNELPFFDILASYRKGLEWFDLSYTDVKRPYLRDEIHQSHDLPDFVITPHIGPDSQERPSLLKNLDLSKCLAVINGRIVRVQYEKVNNELYLLDGARLCRNSSKEKGISPDLMLLNTQFFNGFEIINLSDCSSAFTKDDRAAESYYYDGEVRVVIPESKNINLDTTAMWLVIDGVPYFDNRIRLINRNTFSVRPNELLLKTSIPHRKWLYNEPLSHTEIYEVDENLDNILFNEFQSPKGNSFIICFNVPKIYMYKTDIVNFIDYKTFDVLDYQNNLLFKNNLNSFRPYFANIQDSGETMLYTNDCGELYLAENFDTRSKFTSIPSFRNPTNRDKDLGNSSYSMLSFSTKNYFK